LTDANTWRPCSACKKPIALGATYYVCSVSTCNRPRTGLVFCDVSCWEIHLPIARHREAWAEEQTAPRTAAEARPATRAAAAAHQDRAARPPKRTLARPATTATPPREELPQDILIVASRLKDYVRARAGMNTSERILEPLSKIVRAAVDEAIRNARADERKTVLDRDVPKPR
jgi:hypothetical protein